MKNKAIHLDSGILSSVRLLKENVLLRVVAPYVSLTTACVELVSVVLIPVVLSFGGEKTLSFAFSLANFAALMSSIFISQQKFKWNRPDALRILLSVEVLRAFCICIEALTSSPIIYTIALTIGFLALPFLLISSQIIWLEGVSNAQLGRVSGLQKLSTWLLVPFSYVIGPLLGKYLANNNTVIELEIFRRIAFGSGVFIIIISCVVSVLSPVRQLIQFKIKGL